MPVRSILKYYMIRLKHKNCSIIYSTLSLKPTKLLKCYMDQIITMMIADLSSKLTNPYQLINIFKIEVLLKLTHAYEVVGISCVFTYLVTFLLHQIPEIAYYFRIYH